MKVGISVECLVCGHRKQPVGRSAPLGLVMCDDQCPGYRITPYPGSLWPGETEEEFGYAVGPEGTEEVSAKGEEQP